MLVRSLNGASVLVAGGQTFEPVAPGVFDVPEAIGRALVRFPHFEETHEVVQAAPQDTQGAANEPQDAQGTANEVQDAQGAANDAQDTQAAEGEPKAESKTGGKKAGGKKG